MKYYLKFQSFHSRKCIWKYRLRKGGHFVSASMCQTHGYRIFFQNRTKHSDVILPGNAARKSLSRVPATLLCNTGTQVPCSHVEIFWAIVSLNDLQVQNIASPVDILPVSTQQEFPEKKFQSFGLTNFFTNHCQSCILFISLGLTDWQFWHDCSCFNTRVCAGVFWCCFKMLNKKMKASYYIYLAPLHIIK